jgi:uncharacterized protein
MRRQVLLDTGPLVAFLKPQDQFYRWVTTELATIQPPLLTCEAVIAEACFLLRNTHAGEETVLSLIADAYIQLPFRLETEITAVRQLLWLSIGTHVSSRCVSGTDVRAVQQQPVAHAR